MSGDVRIVGETEKSVDASSVSAEYRRLYDAHYPRVLAYCTRRVGSNDAPDVAADVFVVAWRRLSAVPDGEEALLWLYGVAFRLVSRHWRSQGRFRQLTLKLGGLEPTAVITPEARLVQLEEYEMALTALSRLRPTDQEVLLLTVWEELSHAQTAVVLGVKVGAVRQRFNRAKRALRREFDRIGGTLPPRVVAQEGGER
jgi:RNA polymerase sigma-70 factor, ECF subfamily